MMPIASALEQSTLRASSAISSRGADDLDGRNESILPSAVQGKEWMRCALRSSAVGPATDHLGLVCAAALIPYHQCAASCFRLSTVELFVDVGK